MRLLPSVLLRVRTSTAVCCVEPSSMLYLKFLALLGGEAPVLDDWHPTSRAAAARAATSIFIVFLRFSFPLAGRFSRASAAVNVPAAGARIPAVFRPYSASCAARTGTMSTRAVEAAMLI